MSQLRGNVLSLQSGVEDSLCFCWRNVPDWLKQTAVVEPVDLLAGRRLPSNAVRPFEGCVFHCLEVAPGAAVVNDLSFEQVVDRLGQGIVVTVSDAAD